YFGARFYCNAIGRFITPDWAAKPVTVPYAKFGDPQSLNLYSYVENSPVNRVDPDGHYDCADSKKCDSDEDRNFEIARQKNLQSKDEKVRNAAAAYGDPNAHNGVHVSIESEAQILKETKDTASYTDPGQTLNHKPDISVVINKNMLKSDGVSTI